MPGGAHCSEEDCTCERIVLRTYRELRDKGRSDREAFLSAVQVLALRHPGHERYYYFSRIAKWLGRQHQPYPR